MRVYDRRRPPDTPILLGCLQYLKAELMRSATQPAKSRFGFSQGHSLFRFRQMRGVLQSWGFTLSRLLTASNLDRRSPSTFSGQDVVFWIQVRPLANSAKSSSPPLPAVRMLWQPSLLCIYREVQTAWSRLHNWDQAPQSYAVRLYPSPVSLPGFVLQHTSTTV